MLIEFEFNFWCRVLDVTMLYIVNFFKKKYITIYIEFKEKNTGVDILLRDLESIYVGR